MARGARRRALVMLAGSAIAGERNRHSDRARRTLGSTLFRQAVAKNVHFVCSRRWARSDIRHLAESDTPANAHLNSEHAPFVQRQAPSYSCV
jgi:hypothetical protein